MDMNKSENVEYKHNFYKEIIPDTERKKISDRFEVLSQREDNWDGYDSKKPTELTINSAQHLLEDFFDSVISTGHSWLTPFISSNEDGNVTIEWSRENRRLHIQIGEDEVEYIQVWGINIDTEMYVDFLTRDDYIELWEWLLDPIQKSL